MAEEVVKGVGITPVRRIGILSGAAMSISLMIGSGIFSTPSSVITLAGSPIMGLIIYILGGVLSFGGTMAYIEMGIMYPNNGGTLRNLAHAFPKPRAMLSYLFAFCMIFCIRTGAIAANGPVYSKYWVYGIFGGPDLPTLHPTLWKHRDWIYKGIGVVATGIITLICMFSVKWSLRMINALTVLKIAVLGLFSVSGILVLAGAIKIPKNDNWSRGFKGTSSNPGNYARALNKVFFAYSGWSNVCYSVGEMKNPSRNLPIAATLGVVTVTVLYTFSIVAFYSGVPFTEVQTSTEILAAVFSNHAFGPVFGRRILPIFIGFSVFGSTFAEIFTIGRIVSAAGRVGYLPSGNIAGYYHPKYKTPIYALAFNYIIVLVYLLAPPPGDIFNFLLDFVQYPSWIFYGFTVAGCILLRYKKPNHPNRKFKSLIVSNVLFVIVSIFMAIFPFIPFTRLVNSYPYYLSPVLGLSTLLLGFIPWYLRMYWWADKQGVSYTAWIAEEEEEDHTGL